ncbi:DUF5931 domain-containing protein [Nocardioides marinisabuli]|uniref:DUF5931 domain-containing protein n=1 Tax=Nocardioides marinisabuli TaxID=419476 RepID=UPI0015DFB840|nr:DUF5931 domain-containing protein [Nocardioides marinisabuli]
MEDRLLQALAWLRWVVLANAVVLNVYRYDNFERPLLGMGVVAVLVLWTLLAGHWYADHARRGWPLLVADLAVAVAAMVATPLVKGADFNASVPGFWVMAALLAWAAHLRWQGGLVAAVVLAGTDLAVRQDVSQSVYGNVFLLLIGGPIVGYLAASLQQMATERDRAERAAAAAAERTRLARAVHDGVLQVLARWCSAAATSSASRARSWPGWRRAGERAARADPHPGRGGPVPGAVPGAPGAAGAARVVDLAAELTLLGAVRASRSWCRPDRCASSPPLHRAGRGGRCLPRQRAAARAAG